MRKLGILITCWIAILCAGCASWWSRGRVEQINNNSNTLDEEPVALPSTQGTEAAPVSIGPDAPQPPPDSSGIPPVQPAGKTLLKRWGISLSYIQPGSFLAGSPDRSDLRMNGAYPPRNVTISRGFLIGTTEITRRQWHTVRGEQVLDESQADLPMTGVSFHDALEFCDLLSTKAGRHVRLPTEFEWEYAARAGTTTRYWCGDTLTNQEACFSSGPFNMQTGPIAVAHGNANPWGLYDVHGNVWEWCLSGPQREADEQQKSQIARGGSWQYDAIDCRSSSRLRFPEYIKSENVGMRVVVD